MSEEAYDYPTIELTDYYDGGDWSAVESTMQALEAEEKQKQSEQLWNDTLNVYGDIFMKERGLQYNRERLEKDPAANAFTGDVIMQEDPNMRDAALGQMFASRVGVSPVEVYNHFKASGIEIDERQEDWEEEQYAAAVTRAMRNQTFREKEKYDERQRQLALESGVSPNVAMIILQPDFSLPQRINLHHEYEYTNHQ